MFEDWASLYDSVYAAKGKDYGEEVRYLLRWMGPSPAVRISAVVADERARGESPSARRSLGTVAPEPHSGGSPFATHFVTGMAEPELPSILDVACGTGEHLRHLARRFRLFGVDSSAEMLAVARQKLPGSSLFLSDMTSFDLGRKFDVVTCLFSSIGYLPHVPALVRAIQKMADHLGNDGVLLIEPPIPPERLQPPQATTLAFVHGGLAWERETDASSDGERLHIRFAYRVVGELRPSRDRVAPPFLSGMETPALSERPFGGADTSPSRSVHSPRRHLGVPSPSRAISGDGNSEPSVSIEIVDEQSIRLFRGEEIVDAMERSGLEVEYDSRGPSGLGLYVGRPARS